MPKPHGKCNLCGSRRFLNFAGLCKRCNRKPESAKFNEAALSRQLEVRQREAEMKALEAAMAPTPEETEDGEGEEGETEDTEASEKEDETKKS